MHNVLDRRIAHANKVVTLHDGFETPLALVFYGSNNEVNMKISQKHRELFGEILKIDATAKFKDTKGNEYGTPTDIQN